MRLKRNSKLNGFGRKSKENISFSSKTIEFTVAFRLDLYFASAALLAGLGWARAGGRAGVGRGLQPAASQRAACCLPVCLFACLPACLLACLPVLLTYTLPLLRLALHQGLDRADDNQAILIGCK